MRKRGSRATIELEVQNSKRIVAKDDIGLYRRLAPRSGGPRHFTPVYEQSSEDHPGVVVGKVGTKLSSPIRAGTQQQRSA